MSTQYAKWADRCNVFTEISEISTKNTEYWVQNFDKVINYNLISSNLHCTKFVVKSRFLLGKATIQLITRTLSNGSRSLYSTHSRYQEVIRDQVAFNQIHDPNIVHNWRWQTSSLNEHKIGCPLQTQQSDHRSMVSICQSRIFFMPLVAISVDG